MTKVLDPERESKEEHFAFKFELCLQESETQKRGLRLEK